MAVIGGGNSGVEAAIDLAGIVSHVTLLEFDSKLRADAVLQRKLFSLPNVNVITSALTSEVKGDGQKVTGLAYKNRDNGEFTTIDLEGIFVQIGFVAEHRLAQRHGRTVAPWRDHCRRAWRNLTAGHIRCR